MVKIAYIHPIYKLAIAISISIISLLISLTYGMSPLLRIMVCWDVFAFSYLTLSWITLLYVDIQGIQHVAKNQDSSHIVIFVILLFSTIFSLFIFLFLLKPIGEWNLDKGLVVSIYFLGLFFSFMLLHTIYSFRYAHLYYSKGKEIKGEDSELIFPGEKDPNYIDFAYFSFVIGMTFQVSDVLIHSGLIRRIVLVHSLLSFGFNVVIISLCVNAVVNI